MGAAHKRGDESANVVDEGAASTNGDEDVCLIGDGDERPRGVQWLVDSGASAHMSASKEEMGDYTTVTPFEISIGDKMKLRVIGSGHVRPQVDVDCEVKKVTLKNVLHVPKLAYHLVSVSAMESNGMSTNFAKGKCNIKDGKVRICAQATKKGGMYVLDTMSGGVQGGTACTADVSISLWHARLGHANMRGIASMVKAKAVDGLACTGLGTDSVCESCVYGKAHRLPFPKESTSRAIGVLDLVHSDF
jgi:hypothetical protein